MSDTVIVIQDESILAATGKTGRSPKIEQVCRIPIEGYGDPFEQWKEALTTYKNTYNPGSVKLVLPASYSSTRMTQIPYATGRQLTKMAEKVVAEQTGEGVSDYSVVQADKKKGTCLCCASAESNVLHSLMDICKEIELNVKDISVPMEGYLRGLSQITLYKNKTAIFLIFEENSVTSILFKEGMYLYSTRSRIFSERGTVNFGTEIVRNISGMLQFYSTTKSATPITDVYYAGCMDDDFEVSIEGIENLNLKVSPMEVDITFEAEGEPGDWLSCIGALVADKKKSINLYQIWSAAQKEQTVEKVDIGKHIMFPAITFVACMAVFAGVTLWNHSTSKKIDEVNDWIQSDSVQEQFQAADKLKQQSDTLMAGQVQVQQMKDNLATYPDLTAEMIAKIVDVGGSDMTVSIQTMDAESGVLTFNAVSKKVIDIPSYVNKLQKTGLFSSVDYTGYNYEDEDYSLMLSCVLKAAETGGDEK